MVLNKQDWSIRSEEDLEEAFKNVEKIIDHRLSEGNMSYSVNDLSSFIRRFENKEKFIAFIMQKYQQAGWSVKRNQYSDFRESWDYLSFS